MLALVSLGAGSVPEFNLLLNILQGVALLVTLAVTVPKAITAGRQKAELAAKNSVIETREQESHALKDRIEQLNTDLTECRSNCSTAETDAASWRGKYEEQAKYTAENALSTVTAILNQMNDSNTRLLTQMDADQMRRHDEVMASLSNIATLVGDRRERPTSL